MLCASRNQACSAVNSAKVLCLPFGMVNRAMQYTDRVEMLAPEHVRQAVIEKIKRMQEKYRA